MKDWEPLSEHLNRYIRIETETCHILNPINRTGVINGRRGRLRGGIGMQKKWYEQKGMVLLLLTGAVYFFYGIFLRC